MNPKKQFAFLAFVVLCGVSLSVWLFFSITQKEKKIVLSDFQSEAQSQSSALRMAAEHEPKDLTASGGAFQKWTQNSLKDFPDSELDFYFYDQIRSEGESLLLVHHGAGQDDSQATLTPEEIGKRSKINFHSTFSLGGRQISVTIYPSPDFFKSREPRLGTMALVTGLLLTLLMALYLFGMIRTLGETVKAHQALKEAQSKLILADRLATVGQISAGVAHEMNNPLGFVGNNLETLEKYVNELTVGAQLIAPVQNEKSNKILSDMKPLIAESRDGLDRVKKIVANLRTFARADATDAVETVDLHRVLEGALSIAWNEIKFKAEVVREFHLQSHVRVHTQQMGQVFINLLVNAAQAIEEKGKITVRTSEREGHAVVEIHDNGKGISSEAKKKLFEPFYTTKGPSKGTGLGLSISQEIVNKHGGKIWCESSPGKGTRFVVEIPIGQR